jgi:hypothetical protein
MTIRIKAFGVALPGDPEIVHDKCYIADTEAEMNTITSPLEEYVAFCVATSRFYVRLNSVWAPIPVMGESFVELRTSDPSAPVTGQMWLRTDL